MPREPDDYPDEIEMNSQGGGIGFKDIVMRQVQKISWLANVEFKGGHYATIIDKSGEEKEIYVPDTREPYNNAVLTLAHLLLPKFDKKMEEAYQEYQDTLEKIEQEFMNATQEDEEVILGERFYERTKEKIMLETYKIKKQKMHQILFSELSLMLARINYMEMGGGVF